MPYISQDKREIYEEDIRNLAKKLEAEGWHPGHINFCIYLLFKYAWVERPNYTRGNMLLGVLRAVGSEFYRRVLVGYEDSKRNYHGDI